MNTSTPSLTQQLTLLLRTDSRHDLVAADQLEALRVLLLAGAEL